MDATLLMRVAGIFNVTMAIGLVFLRGPLGSLLKLDPATGTNLVILTIAAALIASLGHGIWRAADDPSANRSLIEVATVAKVAVALSAIAVGFMPDVDWRLPALASTDLIFAAMFVRILRNTRDNTPDQVSTR